MFAAVICRQWFIPLSCFKFIENCYNVCNIIKIFDRSHSIFFLCWKQIICVCAFIVVIQRIFLIKYLTHIWPSFDSLSLFYSDLVVFHPTPKSTTNRSISEHFHTKISLGSFHPSIVPRAFIKNRSFSQILFSAFRYQNLAPMSENKLFLGKKLCHRTMHSVRIDEFPIVGVRL